MTTLSNRIYLFICLSLIVTLVPAQDTRPFAYTHSYSLSQKWSLEFAIKSSHKEPCPAPDRHKFVAYSDDQICIRVVNQWDSSQTLVAPYKIQLANAAPYICFPNWIDSQISTLGEVRIDSTNSTSLKASTGFRRFYIRFSITKETESGSRMLEEVFQVVLNPKCD